MELEEKVIQQLTHQNASLAVAESLTGGLLMSSLVNVPGASRVLKGGFVTYQTQAKVDWLGLPAAFISEYGVVSPQVAQAMATRMLDISQCHYAIGITGYAGPSADPGQAVGDVYLAVASMDKETQVEFLELGRKERQVIREQAKDAALSLLLKELAD